MEEWDKYRQENYKAKKWLIRFTELDHTGWADWLEPEFDRQNILELYFDYPLPDTEDYEERTHFLDVYTHNSDLMRLRGWNNHPLYHDRYIERENEIYEHLGNGM